MVARKDPVSLTPLWIVCIVIGAIVAALTGCAQNIPTTTTQDNQQVQTPVTTTDQDQAAQGTTIHFHLSQIPTQEMAGGDVVIGADGIPIAIAEGLEQSGNGTALANAQSSFQQFNVIHITTGATGADLAGTTTGAATATGTQTSTPTISAELSPEVSLAVAIDVAWAGGLASGAANAAQGGDATQTKSDTNTVRWLTTLAEALKDPGFIDVINGMMGFDPEVTPELPEAPENGE